ncbi:hypothetical protein [Nocardia macrotermitis]|uniref:hypothetical protein n=1 Tax=Nocardia macrotermitis TaxID=2585198 RepID=UPI0018862C52|nr:hypothetical protein [Nocardia macrotermitis]
MSRDDGVTHRGPLGGTAVQTPPRRIRHIRIEAGAVTADYQAGAEQIADIVAELRTNAGITVIVDDNVRPDLPSLPCAGLWD